MHVVVITFSKSINWRVSRSDPNLVALENPPGWSLVHPLVPFGRQLSEPCVSPYGDGTHGVDTRTLHCVVSDAETCSPKFLAQINDLLARLRHVSRQATLPRGNDPSSIHFKDVNEIPKADIPEPYLGKVYCQAGHFDVLLTMDMAERAGALPVGFTPPVYEGLLLDAIRAAWEVDCRSTILYSALAIKAVAGTRIEEEHRKLLTETPVSPRVRAVRTQESNNRNGLEDPVFRQLRKTGRFVNLLHELPLYAMERSLKLEDVELYKRAERLYQTRNALVHQGEPRKNPHLLTVDTSGALEALTCASEVFCWFGVPGKWPLPFVEWLEIGPQGIVARGSPLIAVSDSSS